MKAAHKIKNLPAKMKNQLTAIALLLCMALTFAVPFAGGGYSVLKNEPLRSSAAAIEDIDLLLVGASAFGEARKVVNASDNEAIDTFVRNTAAVIAGKWQNIGLIVGAREALSGTAWNIYQSPITLSATEVGTYKIKDEDSVGKTIAEAYNRYKAFGYAVQNLNSSAQKSDTSAVSINEGLNAMSKASIKLGSFGVKFLEDYNPAPVLLALYDSSNLTTYADNKLVQIVTGNDALKNIVCLFGDKVAGTNFSFFVIINAVLAIMGFAFSLFLTLLGNRNIGDGLRQFTVRILIGTVGIYVIGSLMSTCIQWVNATVTKTEDSPTSAYVESNLNVYDWYLTGFALPTGTELPIDTSGNFVFNAANVRAINEYTYGRLTDEEPTDEKIKERMETYTQNGNSGVASFITPSKSTSAKGDDDGGSAWATDAYYAIMSNYAQNKEDLLEGKDEEGSPLSGKTSVRFACQYFWMSSLRMEGDVESGWTVKGFSSDSYYGLNPISAFNLVRSDFAGEAITSTSTVYPAMSYVAFDVTSGVAGPGNMNAITRFIASFTLIMAALKGLITIFTAGFGGIFAGGAKTAFGSSHGFGQAVGGVIALMFGIIGISVLMSMTLSLLDTVFGIAKDLLVGSEAVEAFLEPLQEAVGGIPVIGSVLMKIATSIVDLMLTLILSLTFPKLGGIPITVFSQFMADLPGHMAEKGQMIEGMLMSGRSSASAGGLGPRGGSRGGSGQYGRQAAGMASNAFASGSRQAAGVVSAGAKAGAALLGASLATAGRHLNKKADSISGKPDNPGISNWGDLTPEQQARAAEVAAKTEGWENMSEEAKQAALKEAGIYNDNNANTATPGVDPDAAGSQDAAAEGNAEDLGAADPAMQEGAAAAAAEDSVSEEPGGETGGQDAGDGAQDAPPAPETGTPAVPDTPVEGSIGGMPAGVMPGEAPAPSDTVPEGGSLSGDGGSGVGADGKDGSSPSDTDSAADGNGTLNVDEQNNAANGDQNFDTHVDQKNHIEAKSVDESKQLNNESSELGPDGTDGKPGAAAGSLSDDSKAAIGMAGAAADKAKESGIAASQDKAGQDGRTGKTGKGARASETGKGTLLSNGPGKPKQDTAAAHKSVNSSSQTGGNNTQNANARIQSNAQVHAGGNTNQTINSRAAGAAQGIRPAGPNPESPRNGAGNGLPEPGMDAMGSDTGQGSLDNRQDGTAASAWGKQMSLKEQRQARALHAAGDALQMMGGNRSMQAGVQDALKHAKDAAMAYAVPPELDDPANHPFLANVRSRRQKQQSKEGKK